MPLLKTQKNIRIGIYNNDNLRGCVDLTQIALLNIEQDYLKQ